MTGRQSALLPFALAAVALGSVAACQSAPGPQAGAVRASASRITVLATPDVAPPTQAPAAVTHAQFVAAPDGTALPDTTQTPGGTEAAASQATVCAVDGSTKVTTTHVTDKLAAYAAYGLTHDDRSAHRLDHLVPVSLGGSSAVTNLWPQPIAGGQAERKDQLELRLHQLVCAGTLALPAAQTAIASNWVLAVTTYGAGPVPTVPPAPPAAAP